MLSSALPFRVAEDSIVLADVNGRKIVAENTIVYDLSRVREVPCSALLLSCKLFHTPVTQRFFFVPLTSVGFLLNMPIFTILCSSAGCPKRAIQFGGHTNGNVGNKVLKRKVQE